MEGEINYKTFKIKRKLLMKAIIMAAGVGKRLLGLNMNKPKCLLTASGSETLIRRSVNLLVSKGISDITVIVGYKADLIRNELNNDVTYFENPHFLTTNSIMSLWYAKDLLEDRCSFIKWRSLLRTWHT